MRSCVALVRPYMLIRKMSSVTVDEISQKLYMKTGLLNKLPCILGRDTMLDSATKRMEKIRMPSINRQVSQLKRVRMGDESKRKKISGTARKTIRLAEMKISGKKMRETYSRKYDVFVRALEDPIPMYAAKFPPLNSLHPFESAVIDLTLQRGKNTYAQLLAKYSKLQISLRCQREKDQALLKKITYHEGAALWFNESISRIKDLLQRKGQCIDDLKQMAKTLYNADVLNPLLPTTAMVGMPNVGKSSLVKAISTGSPEVQNYPFTTRSIIVGHIHLQGFAKGRNSLQVSDTPGMLARPSEERNAMEKLTEAVLENFPAIMAVFVVDASLNPGAPLSDQFKLRAQLRQRFPQHQWLDVVSKYDISEHSRADLETLYGKDSKHVIFTSIVSQKGIAELIKRATVFASFHLDNRYADNVKQQKLIEEQEAKAKIIEPVPYSSDLHAWLKPNTTEVMGKAEKKEKKELAQRAAYDLDAHAIVQ